MSFTEWSNKKKEEREAAQKSTVKTTSGTSGGGASTTSFSEWSNKRKETSSVQGWLDSITVLVGDINNYHKNWHSGDDEGYTSLRDRASSLLSQADGWRKQYAGNNEAVSAIDSYVSNLVKAKEYSWKAHDYYAQWASEEDYSKALKRSTVEGRQDLYEENKKRLEELKAERDANWRTYLDATGGVSYGVPRNSVANDHGREIESLETEILRYERGEGEYEGRGKVVDDYSGIQQKADFDTVSARRDFGNPDVSELRGPLTTTDSSLWHYNATGELIDPYGNTIGQATTTTTHEIADKLGMYFSAVEAGISDSSGTAIATILAEGGAGNWSKLSKNEISTYYYLLNTAGQETAYKYLADMKVELNRRYMTEYNEDFVADWDERSALEKLAYNMASIPARLIGGTLSMADDTFTTLRGETINPYSSMHLMQNFGQTVLGTQAAEIDEAAGGAVLVPVINFGYGDAYQALMSVGDMVLGGTVFGGAGYGAIMGMGAASSEAKRLYQQGASNEQIALGAGLAGTAEMVFEKLSIEHLVKLGSAEAIRQTVFGILKQAGVEGSEEALTEISNIITNHAIMASQSDFSMELDANGGDWGKTLQDKFFQVLHAGIAGAIAGGLGGGGASIGSYAANQAQFASDGRAIMDTEGGLDALRALSEVVSAYTGVTEQTKKTISGLSEKASTGAKTAIGKALKTQERAVGRLWSQIGTAVSQANQVDVIKSLERKGFSAKQAKAIAEAIEASYSGRKLTTHEQRLLADKRVKQTIADVVDNSRSTSNHRSRQLAAFAYGVEQGATFSGKAVAKKSASKGSSAPEVKQAVESHFEASADGQTILKDGGDAVSIEGVASNSGGKLTLKLTDGRTVDADSVAFASEDEAFVYSAIADMGVTADAANVLLESYRLEGVVSGQMFANGIIEAYRYGSFNYPASELAAGAFTSKLTENQRMKAYRLGQTFGGKQTAKAEATVRKNRTVAKNATTGKVHFDGDRSGLTERQSTSLSALETVADALGVQVYVFESKVDDSGKHIGANGWYDPSDGSIHIDLHAGMQGEATMLFTAAHELTHFIKQWSPAKFKVLANFLMQEYGKKGVSVESLVQAQIAKAKNNGREISYDVAYEEVIADSMETMLADGKVMEKLAKLKQQDKSLWQKIKDFISELATKIRTLYEGLNPDSVEGRYVAEMKDAIEQLQELFAEGLVVASENYQASLTPGEVGTVFAENGDPVAHSTGDGTIQLSMRTYEEEGRTAFRKYLEKCVSSKRLTKAQMQEMLDGIEEIYTVCQEFKDKYAPFGTWSQAAVVRDTYGKPVFSVVTPNGEYKMNLDFSLVCKKRRSLDAVFNEMARRGIIDNFELGQKSVVKINEIIRKHGFETACALCFVDAKRFRQAAMADMFTNLYNELVTSLVPESQRGSIGYFNFSGNESVKAVSSGIDTWADSELDFSHIDEVMRTYEKGTVEYKAAKYIKAHAEGRRLLQRGDFMSSKGFDAVKKQNRSILSLYNSKKGTGGPKAAFGDVQYMNEIIKKARHWTPAKAYSVGGVRIQSFSDYVPRMVFDYVQMIYDLAATNLPAHAYTKEALFAKQFGLTGIKINMSLIPAIADGGIAPGLDANGDYVWAGESFDYETAVEIQNAEGYTENCGTICVGVSYQHILNLLSDPNIRMVIPYHKSGLNPIVAHMNRIAAFTDYTGNQNTKDSEGKKVSKDFDFNKALRSTGDPKAAVREYFDWCSKNGYTPRFAEFAWHENYYKLIEDFTLYDKDGNYVPQRGVRAVFPTADSAFGSMKSLIEAGLQEDAVIEGKRDARLGSIVDEIERTLPKTEAEIPETEVAQADRDLEAEVKYSDRGYSYEALASKPDMVVTAVSKTVPKNRADVVAQAKKNATSVGKANKDGSVSVYVDDIGADVILGTKGLTHGLRRINKSETDPNWIVTLRAGDIIKNAIRINEMIPSKEEASGAYVLIGTAQSLAGDLYVVRFVVNQFSNELASMDVLYAINAKKGNRLRSMRPGFQGPVTDSSISVAELLDHVNQYFPDVLPEDVLKHYGHDRRPDGDLGEDALFSDRDSDGHQLTEEQSAFFAQSKVRLDEDGGYWYGEGNLAPVYHATDEDFTVFYRKYLGKNTDSNASDESYAATAHLGFWFNTGDLSGGKLSFLGRSVKAYLNITNPYYAGTLGNLAAEIAAESPNSTSPKRMAKAYLDKLRWSGYDGIVIEDEEMGGISFAAFEPNQIKRTDNLKPTGKKDIRYSDRDSDGRQLSAKQKSYFRNSQVRDEQGRLLVMYHGTNTPGFTIFNPKKSDDGISLFFTDSTDVADSYKESEGDEGRYSVFLNITNPYILDAGKDVSGMKSLVRISKIARDRWSLYMEGVDGSRSTQLRMTEDEVNRFISNALGSTASRSALRQFKSNGEFELEDVKVTHKIPGKWNQLSFQGKTAKTRDVTKWAKEHGYDGVIFRNVIDFGGYSNVKGRGGSTLAVAFSSNQVKATTNKFPTHLPDIRFSDRASDSVSNRTLLANAFENLAQHPDEEAAIRRYKEVADHLDEEQRKLDGLRAEIRELSFAKGKKDTKRIKELQFEANQIANRINTYDRQLLKLATAKPLQAVLEREKKLAYKKAEQKGKKAMAAYKERVAKTNRELLERYQESRKKGVDSRRKTAMRHKIKDVVHELNDYLLHGTKDRHVPIQLQKAVAEALNAVNMDTVGAEERIAKLQEELMKAKTPEQIQEISRKIDHIREMGENMDRRLGALKEAYDDFINSDDPLVSNAYDEVISLKMESVIKAVGNTPLRDMTLEQLEEVYDMYRVVLTRIRGANKTFKQDKAETISILGNRVMMEVEKVGGKKKHRIVGADAVSSFVWNTLKPVYAFERIGSETFTRVFNSVRAGEDVWARDVTEAREFYLAQAKKFSYDSWDLQKSYKFTSSSGMEFELNLEQIMSLYAYSKRDQAGDHLMYGGFVFDPKTEVVVKTKHGVKVKVNLNEATAYNLSPETLAEIVSKLSAEQKGFVDVMQDYLSTTMGEKGNEVSLEMYGIKLFKEKFYFPLKSATQFMAKAKEQAQGEVRIKNSGFSKETTPKARNPIVLTSFMDVWASHVNEMSMYHAFVLPMEDFYRVFNYKTPTSDTMATESVEMFIQNAYGTGATQYIEQLLKDLNGGARTDSTTGIINKGIGLFKKGAVFASLSVVIQQPSAIARAMALIDSKYFVGAKVDRKRHKALWAELKQYAPVAIIKEMGYFDTGMGQSTTDFIKAKEYSGIADEMKALVTDSGYRDEIFSKAPALADELAWCGIWEAVKREGIARFPGMDAKSEAFLKLCGGRFTEIITKTQVYDSVMSRSALMRSKDTGMKMATAFMAEPTTSINMVANALIQGKRGNRRYARKAIGAVIASQILNSILVSFVYAGRDDDEDETYWEKYIGTFTGEVLDSMNPLTYIPFVKDIVSIVQGYDVERSDMAIISDLWTAYENLSKDTVSPYRKVEGFVGSICQIFGLPVKNIMRDARAIYQTVESFMNGQQTTGSGIKYAVTEAVTGKEVSDKQQLYEAYLSGDKTQIARVEGRYKDQTAINSAIRSALKEYDPRITEAAQAKVNGDLDEYMRIAKQIIGEKVFSQDDVVRAINSVIGDLTPKDDTTTSTSKVSGLFKTDDFAVAISQGDRAMANAVKTDIIQTAQKNGKTAEEAEKSFASSATSEIKGLFLAGSISESKAVDALVTYCGKDEDDAMADVQYWAFSHENPDTYASDSWFDTYFEKVVDSGITIDTYMDYRNQASECKADLDENGKTISGSRKAKVLAVIDSLPITSAQKDALYFAEGWAESKLYEAPWH